jgi:threonine/homoserine/homoserine lactone efflux protein
MSGDNQENTHQHGRRIALVIAATGIFWVAATWIGGQMGLSNRTRALFDLMALAGFGYAIWMTYQIWRARQT